MPSFQASSNREQRNIYQFKSDDVAFEIYGMHYGIRYPDDEILPKWQENFVQLSSTRRYEVRYRDIISCNLDHTYKEGVGEIEIKSEVFFDFIRSYKLWDYVFIRKYNFNGTIIKRPYFFVGFERSVTNNNGNDEEKVIVKLENFEKYVLSKKMVAQNVHYNLPLPEEEPYNFNKVQYNNWTFKNFINDIYDKNLFADTTYLGVNSNSTRRYREIRGFINSIEYELNGNVGPRAQFVKEPDYVQKMTEELYNANDSVKIPRIRLDFIKQNYVDELERECYKFQIVYEFTKDFELSFPNDYRVLEFKESWDKSETIGLISVPSFSYPNYATVVGYPNTSSLSGPRLTPSEKIESSDAEPNDNGSDDRSALGREKARENKIKSQKSVNISFLKHTFLIDIDVNSILTLKSFPFAKENEDDLQYAVRKIEETFSKDNNYIEFDITELEEVIYEN